MFGGCCGDGTRLQDVFLLDLTDSTEDGGETDDDKEGGDGKDDDQVIRFSLFCHRIVKLEHRY